MDALPGMIAMALVLAVVFFFVLAGGCVIAETMEANSNTDNPPQVFQWAAGWECTENVWRHYIGSGE